MYNELNPFQFNCSHNSRPYGYNHTISAWDFYNTEMAVCFAQAVRLVSTWKVNAPWSGNPKMCTRLIKINPRAYGAHRVGFRVTSDLGVPINPWTSDRWMVHTGECKSKSHQHCNAFEASGRVWFHQRKLLRLSISCLLAPCSGWSTDVQLVLLSFQYIYLSYTSYSAVFSTTSCSICRQYSCTDRLLL